METDPGIKIVYHDTDLVVVDKPSGMLSVPGRGPDKHDCVVSRVIDKFPHIIPQPAIHRLDMQTSGLMLLAKTTEAHRHVSIQFEKREVIKSYIALVEGIITEPLGEIRLSFRLDPDNRPRQVYDPIQGKEGITRWRRLATEENRTRIEFTPLTGRTHQLRLHAAHPKGLGAPIVGDRLYGAGVEGEPMLLHATGIEFRHPRDSRSKLFFSPAPF